MKKITLLSFLFLAFIALSQKVNAQLTTDPSLPVTVNIDLTADVLSLTLGADQTVDFVYTTAADYAQPKSETIEDHLTVVSSREYNITVLSNQVFTRPAGGTIDLDVMQLNAIAATPNSGTPVINVTLTSGTASPLVNGAPATIEAIYDVTYEIPDASTFIDLDRGIYTTTVTYTVTQI